MKNTLSRWFLAAALTLVPLAASAAAPTLQVVASFEAIDAVTVTGTLSSVTIEGLPEGATDSVSQAFSFSSASNASIVAERCQQMGLLAQAHPGRYLFQVLAFPQGSPTACRLRSR
jgi:hypothetical protein